MSVEGLLRELLGPTCICGNDKKARHTFCTKCYWKLDPGRRDALYHPVGNGYEEAYADALAELKRLGRVSND